MVPNVNRRTSLDKHKFQRQIVIIFLPEILSISVCCSKEPSHLDGFFEYPKLKLWLRNKKFIFLLRALN